VAVAAVVAILRAMSALDRRFGNRAGPTVDDYLQPYSMTTFRNGYRLRLADVAWFGKVEVFITADAMRAPVLTKNAEDAGGRPLQRSDNFYVFASATPAERPTRHVNEGAGTSPS
jgi:hypothetical protein